MKHTRIAIRPQASVADVISLAPVIAALKRRNAQTEVGLVAEEALREASLLLPELDFFLSESEAVGVEHWIDLRSSTGLEEPQEAKDWKAYLQAAASITLGNPYHLIDLHRKAALVDTVDVNFELANPEPTEVLPESLTAPGGLRIALCTSSLSQEAIEGILEGVSQLTVTVDVFLVGTVKDKRVSAAVSSPWDGKLGLHDLCGRLSLTAHAAVLRACDISIVGPGVSALLSAGYGTFTICIDPNPDRGPLLYPYGHGHLIVQQSTGEELYPLLPALLRDILSYTLQANSGNVPSLEQWQAFADSQIESYLGKVRLMATQRVEVSLKEGQSFTELYLRPLLFLGSEAYDVMQIFYRLLWEHSLSGRAITTYDLQVLHQDSLATICGLLKPLEQLYELANFGRTYSHYVRDSLKKSDMARAKYESQRLQEVEELVHGLGTAQAYLLPLCIFHQQRQLLLETEVPLALAEEMIAQFSQLESRVLVLLDLAKSLFHTTFLKESALSGASLAEDRTDG